MKFGILFTAIASFVLACSLATPVAANAATISSGDGDSEIGTVAWAARFVWRNVDNTGQKECRRGRTYTFYLAGRPTTAYLTAETKLRLRIRKDDRVFTRRVELFFGDGDLVWQPFVGKRARIVRASVVASGENAMPRKGHSYICGRY